MERSGLSEIKLKKGSLERRGILFGARPFRDENGEFSSSQGVGMIIIRANTRAEAKAIAFSEPFTNGLFVPDPILFVPLTLSGSAGVAHWARLSRHRR